VVGLIAGGSLLALAVITVAVAHGRLLGPQASVPSVLGSDVAGRVLVGLVQVAVCAGAAAGVIATMLRRRFRCWPAWPWRAWRPPRAWRRSWRWPEMLIRRS